MAKGKKTSVYFDRDKLAFVGLEDIHIKQFKESYQHLDIDAELKKMGLWLLSTKGKNRVGNLGFILNWLNNSNAMQRPTISDQFDLMQSSSPLGDLICDYLEDLWKDKRHILEFNKIAKTN